MTVEEYLELSKKKGKGIGLNGNKKFYVNPEDTLQINLLTQINLEFPDTLVFSVPNETHKESFRTRQLFTKKGLLSGVSDLIFLEPRIYFIKQNNSLIKKVSHGLCLELKTEENRNGATENQLAFQERAIKRGYVSIVSVGYDSSLNIVRKYLNNKLIIVHDITNETEK